MKVDPSDPIAAKTQWGPLEPGGASFRTHRVVRGEDGSLRVGASLGMWLFCGGFMGLGLSLLGTCLSDQEAVGALVGLVFFVIGAVLLVAGAVPRTFDNRTRRFWIGRSADKAVGFSSIHAVQIIPKHVSGSESSYWSYELNLVLKDGERLNVLDHGDLEAVRDVARQVTQVVGCKQWEETGSGVSE